MIQRQFTAFLIFSMLLTVFAGAPRASAFAAHDGTGTLSLSQSTVSAGASAQSFTFTYTAAVNGTANGTLTIDVPAGWTAATTVPGPGLVTATAGTVATAGQTITVSSLNLAVGNTFTIKYDGVTVGATPGPVTFAANEQSMPGGTLTALAASPSVDVVADGAGSVGILLNRDRLTAGQPVADITFAYTAAGGMTNGSLTLDVPAGWPAPTIAAGAGQVTASTGTVSVSGRTITVSGLTMLTGDVVSIIYHGVTVPGTPGSYSFAAREKSTAGGTLTPLQTSPEVLVYAQDGSGTMTVSPGSFMPGQTGAGLTFSYTAPAGGLWRGALTLVVPAGWTPPSQRFGKPVLLNVPSLPGLAPGVPTGGPCIPLCISFPTAGPGIVQSSTGMVSVSGQTITVAAITLAPGQTMTVSYSNVTVGTTTGRITFAAQQQSMQYSTLNSLAVSPSVIVGNLPDLEPGPPFFTPPASYVTIAAPVTETREKSITVTGTAIPGASVSVGGQSVKSDGHGQWSAVIPLTEGQNQIAATSGTAFASVTILRHSTPPVLTLTASAMRTDAETVTLTATSEAGAKIAIEGLAGGTNTVRLAIGSNTFTATAVDRLGNQSTATVTVERIRREPVRPEPVPVTVKPDQPAPPAVPAVPAAPAKLTDIAGHWAQAAILHMVQQNVVSGYEDHSFRPENPVTRLEFAVMLARALKLAPQAQPLPFTDAAASPTWAQPQLAALVQGGIIHGRADGSFDPQGQLTRAEAAVILTSALHYLGRDAKPGTAALTDAGQIPLWAMDAIQTVTNLRIMVGDDTGAFGPARPMTRAEVAALLERMLALK